MHQKPMELKFPWDNLDLDSNATESSALHKAGNRSGIEITEKV
jgi:hypothetical protein